MSQQEMNQDREPVLRVQVSMPRWLFWMLVGVALGNINDVDAMLSVLSRLLT